MMLKLILFLVKCSLSIWSLLSLSIAIYFTIYQIFIPKYSLIEPVFFHHDISCTQMMAIHRETYHQSTNTHQIQNRNHNQDYYDPICQLIHYEIPNKRYRNFFKSGHQYDFELELRMPDSAVNQRLGMFMIRLRLFSADGVQLFEIYRPAILPYQSPLLSLIKMALRIMFYAFGWITEIHTVTVTLLDEHADIETLDFGKINKIRLEIETLREIEIVPPSKLKIQVNLEGILYWMYFWPLTTSVIIIGYIFFTLFVIYICSFLRKSRKPIITTERSILSSSPPSSTGTFFQNVTSTSDLLPSSSSSSTSHFHGLLDNGDDTTDDIVPSQS